MDTIPSSHKSNTLKQEEARACNQRNGKRSPNASKNSHIADYRQKAKQKQKEREDRLMK